MNQVDARSIRSIRRRLLMLLLRSFGIVVFLTVVLILIAAGAVITRNTGTNPFYRSPTAIILETYYLGHGSWQGVEAVLEERTNTSIRALRPDWERTILLDASEKVILDHGSAISPLVGLVYSPEKDEIGLPLVINGSLVGTLLTDRGTLPRPFQLIFYLIGPTAVISVLLGILTLIIGLLLMRRMINPLSEVIAAAQTVSQGDLTARVPVHARHDDISALSDHFNHMADELERSDRQRRNLLADIAHELRTPITILRGRLEGILDGVYPPDEAHIAPALEETYLLERLVEDLRLLALAEANQLRFELKPLRLTELAKTTLGLFSAQAGERNINLRLEADADLPEVMVDPQRFQQVIGNLIDNALRYTSEGSSIDVAIHNRGTGVELSVADDGPGVPEAELPYVFDRLWRGEKSRARSTGGVGLGLSIALPATAHHVDSRCRYCYPSKLKQLRGSFTQKIKNGVLMGEDNWGLLG
jgi:two-component system OmpR family sensor kinase/two-component system sensor histidine kinase BaeS